MEWISLSIPQISHMDSLQSRKDHAFNDSISRPSSSMMLGKSLLLETAYKQTFDINHISVYAHHFRAPNFA